MNESEISAAEQAYLLAIRQSRGGEPLSAADLARRMRVSPQATSEMLRRLSGTGLVSIGEARNVCLTPKGQPRGGRDLPAPRARRVAAVVGAGDPLGRDRSGGHPPAGPHLAARGGRARRAAGPSRDVPARQSHRRGHRVPGVRRSRRSAKSSRVRASPSIASPRRPRRTAAWSPIWRHAACGPVPQVTILARSESTDSLTLEGPLGRATLGLAPGQPHPGAGGRP